MKHICSIFTVILLLVALEAYSQDDGLYEIMDPDIPIVSNSQADYDYKCYQWNKARNWASIKPIDTARFSVIYDYCYAVQGRNGYKMLNDMHKLQIGGRINRCYSMYSQKRDSVAFAYLMSLDPKWLDDIEPTYTPSRLRRAMDAWIPEDVCPLYYDVYTFNDNGKWMVSSRFLDDEYQYTEDIQAFSWNMIPGNDTIQGFVCNKAETIFRGRKWTAWFTFDLPYSYGPWKFCGLPGLILKVEDSEGLFKWVASGFGKVQDDPIYEYVAKYSSVEKMFNWIPKRNVRKCSRSEMDRMWKRFWNAPVTIKLLEMQAAIYTDAEGKNYKVSLSDPVPDGYYPRLELDLK